MATLIKSDGQFIVEAIEERIRKEANRIFEEEKETMIDKLVQRLEEEREKTIASIVIRLSKHFQIDQNKEHIILRIETSDLIRRTHDGKK